jgi:hypothetical protein
MRRRQGSSLTGCACGLPSQRCVCFITSIACSSKVGFPSRCVRRDDECGRALASWLDPIIASKVTLLLDMLWPLLRISRDFECIRMDGW